MLTLPEELLLLAHDEKSGTFIELPDLVLNVALAGAVLMDLALRDRIDMDIKTATVVSGRLLLGIVVLALEVGHVGHAHFRWLRVRRPAWAGRTGTVGAVL